MTRVNIKRVKIKKPSAKTMRNKCDALWRKIVKVNGKCEWCKKSGWLVQLHAHHVIGRSNFNLRWDLRNGICLCAGCHKMRRDSAHEDPQGFMIWFKKHRPEDYEYLLGEKNRTLDFINYHKVLEYLNIMEVESEIYNQRKNI